MTNRQSNAYTELAYLGGTKAITDTPVVGHPVEPYADIYIPGAEKIKDG